ncbi:43kDa postsynaptic protein [Trema orientale]|uniref:RING-type E3 ubiquitin transferase n=1 Tax=Trema orientale TaxID=63057 RepID=A0A2P5FQB9_TREOI|nr:43kDa postsynaptic protein [Trema orientale]
MTDQLIRVEPEAKDAIINEIVSQTEETLGEMGLAASSLTVTAKIYVSSDHSLEEDDMDDERVRRWMEEYEERNWDQIMGLVPARESAIEGLEKVTTRMGRVEIVRCIICLDEIPGGSEVSRLRCLHEFHGKCIRAWLKRNHYCPLRRFELPSSPSSTT